MPRKQRVRVEEDEEDDELPSDLVPSRKPRKQRLKDEADEEDAMELPERSRRGKDEPENEPVEPPTRRACSSSLARATALCAGAVIARAA